MDGHLWHPTATTRDFVGTRASTSDHCASLTRVDGVRIADHHTRRRDGENFQARCRLDDCISGSFSPLVVGLSNDALAGMIRIQMHGKYVLPFVGGTVPAQRIALPCSLVERRTSSQDVLIEIDLASRT